MSWRQSALIALILTTDLWLPGTGVVFAHSPGPEAPASRALWSAWTLDPLVLLPLAAAIVLYATGVRASWRRAGAGRGVRRWEAACFAAGAAAVFLALVWPLDVLGEALFSAHMGQHLLLMNIAAPLLVLGAPVQAMLRALPRAWRRSLGSAARGPVWRAGCRGLTGAAAATVIQQIALWTWHTPDGVAVALESDAAHIVMHLSLMSAALLFWTAVLRPRGRRYWASVAALAATLKISGMVCILLLLLPAVRYSAYGDSAAAWGLSAAEDEQLGWGLMMVVGTTTYLAAAIALVALAFTLLQRANPPTPAWASAAHRDQPTPTGG